MRHGSTHPLIHYLRTLAVASVSSDATDEELLVRFLRTHDEAAFAVLVRRYGPLVFGVCRRVLGQAEDAEDAFQATFVVLAQKAGSIRHRGSLVGFLHGVAERIARKARRARSRRRDRAMPVPERSVRDAVASVMWSDLRSVLDEEIRRLPVPYREAFILCHLEGHSNAEAARRLGCPKGTVLSRLARARERLARRLSRRGITLPAAAFSTLMSVEMLRASVPAKLAAATVRLAGLLAVEGTLPAALVSGPIFTLAAEGGKTMLWTKAILIAGIVATSAALTASALDPRIAPASVEMPSPPLTAASAPGAKPEPQLETPKKQKEETPLEIVLRKWAEADAKISAMHVRFTKTERDGVYETETVTTGHASIKKPDLWRVDHLDKERRMRDIWLTESERWHWFNAERKTVTIVRFSEPAKEDRRNGGRSESSWFFGIDLNNFVNNLEEQTRWLSFGPQARDINSRCDLRLSKQDKWYIYLDVAPHRKGQHWFRRGRIVLNCKDHQVRQVWFEYPNLSEVVVDFLDRQTNPKEPITRDSLWKGLPKGWRRKELNGADKSDK
jgi:RNA polymerase sigma factor (sigma-70 family)